MKPYIILNLLLSGFTVAFAQESLVNHYKIQYHFLVEKSIVRLEDDSIKIIYNDAEGERVISKIPLQVTPRFDINFYYTCVGWLGFI